MYQNGILDAVKKANPPDPLGYVTEIVKPLAIETLRRTILNCHDCPGNLYKMLPHGNEKASVLVLTDFPTEKKGVEIKYENADEWKIIKKVISAYHINLDSLFFTNAVSCCFKRQPDNSAMKKCKVFVDYAFKVIDPILVLVLGNFALNAVREDVNIIKKRGEFINVRGVKAMVTYSPRHLLKLEETNAPDLAREYKEDFSHDILKAFLWLQKEYPDNDVLFKKLAS